MLRRPAFSSSVLLALLGFSLALPASGQKKGKADAEKAEKVNLDEDTSSDEKKEDDEEKKEEEGEAAAEGEEGDEKAEDERPVEPADDAGDEKSPLEKPGETYRFVGLRYRLIIVPQFVMGLFGEGGATLPVHSFGPEFAIRKDGFEYVFALTYTPYSMDQTAFKATSDPEEAWEVVESRIKVLYLTADFMWSHAFSPQVSLIYGGGAGLGLVFGSLYRTQAYLAGGEYLPCVGNGVPPVLTSGGVAYCANDPEENPQHYPGYTEPSWADGGSKPIIFPWIAIQTGVRWKPHRNFVGRLEVGLGLGQFFLGVGADYGL